MPNPIKLSERLRKSIHSAKLAYVAIKKLSTKT